MMCRQNSLLCVMLVTVFVYGFFFRINGFSTHATYIDELICLTGGNWNSEGMENSYGYTSAWDYAEKVFLNDGITYAPLKFLATYYFIKPFKPLSQQALVASRIPSVIVGCLGIVFLFLLFYLLAKGLPVYSYLLPLTLLSISRINIVNSQQNHTYILGVFAFIVLALTLLWLYNSKKYWIGIVAGIILCVLPFSNYQIVPIMILGALFTGTGIRINMPPSQSSRNFAWFKIASLVPAFVVSVGLAAWIVDNKASASIPWWAMPFGLEESSGEGVGERFFALLKNVYFVLESLFMSGANRVVDAISLTLAVLITGGGVLVAIRGRFRAGINALPLLLSFATFGLFVYLYVTRAIALAPSRHTLILGPPVFIVIFYGSFLIEQSISNGTVLKAYKGSLLVLSSVLLIGAFVQYPGFFIKKTEAFQPQKIIEFSEKENLNLVVTDWWTYDKVYILMEKDISANRIQLKSVGEEADFPDEPFLLVGQNTEEFANLYDPGNYENHTSTLLYEHNPEYDFEPSHLINYWPNKMLIYRVEKIEYSQTFPAH